MRALAIFLFETGDASVPFWTEAAIIESELHYAQIQKTVQDSIATKNLDETGQDSEYGEYVQNVLSASGLTWRKFTEETINTYFLFYV